MTARVVALVPMRHESERIPGKNYRPFAGRPLYRHIVDALLASGAVELIALDTDSEVILEDARRHYPQVRLIHRPEHLRAGTVPMNDVLLHDVTQVEGEYFLQTHSTNPLLRAETIRDANRRFFAAHPEHDSLLAVTRLQERLWDAQGRAINHDPAVLLRTQDLQPVYLENSCLYIFTRSMLLKRRNRVGERPLLYQLDPVEAWDIDLELDFQIAEFLYQKRLERR
jgi:CMP-N-acetylneuraminic acid synthetase